MSVPNRSTTRNLYFTSPSKEPVAIYRGIPTNSFFLDFSHSSTEILNLFIIKKGQNNLEYNFFTLLENSFFFCKKKKKKRKEKGGKIRKFKIFGKISLGSFHMKSSRPCYPYASELFYFYIICSPY